MIFFSILFFIFDKYESLNDCCMSLHLFYSAEYDRHLRYTAYFLKYCYLRAPSKGRIVSTNFVKIFFSYLAHSELKVLVLPFLQCALMFERSTCYVLFTEFGMSMDYSFEQQIGIWSY